MIRFRTLSILLCLSSVTLADDVVDLLSKDVKPFINTDQSMISGNVNKTNLHAIQTAFKNSKPTDNIKTCDYDQNKICKITIRERMPTIIQLPKYEWVDDWILGDEVNFEVDTVGNTTNSVTLKGYYPGVDTSFSIIGGSGLIYSFYVLNNPVTAKDVSDFIVNITTSDEILEKISQAKRFYKDNPIPDEKLDDIKHYQLQNQSLHTAFRKILPRSWNLNIDKKLQNRDRLFDVIAQDKTRRQAILDLAESLKLKAMFYPKLRLLVVTDKDEVVR